MKTVKQISIPRILIGQLILWPIFHLIIAFASGGISLLFTWIVQLIDLCSCCKQRAKFAEAQRQEMLEAIRAGNSANVTF